METKATTCDRCGLEIVNASVLNSCVMQTLDGLGVLQTFHLCRNRENITGCWELLWGMIRAASPDSPLPDNIVWDKPLPLDPPVPSQVPRVAPEPPLSPPPTDPPPDPTPVDPPPDQPPDPTPTDPPPDQTVATFLRSNQT